MVKTFRIIASAAVLGLALAVLVTVSAPSGSEAGDAVGTCTKAPDLRYDCTKNLAVNDHIQVNANGGICHANVTAVGTISPTLKSATININHGVTNCAWQPGTNVTIGWRLAGTPTPTNNPVAVGGIAGLIEGDAAPASGSSGTGSGFPLPYVAIVAVSVAAAIGLVVRLRPKAGTIRD